MPTFTHAGQGSSYLLRNQFNPKSIVSLDIDSLDEVPSKVTRRAGGGPATILKVLAAVGAVCIIGAAIGAAVALTAGKTETTTTTTVEPTKPTTVTTTSLTASTTTTASTSTSSSSSTTTSSTSTTISTSTSSTSRTTSSTTTTTTTTEMPALSLSAQVTASSFYSGAGTATAQGDSLVDRSQSTYYSSGAYAPQYVQLELAGTYSIRAVCLQVAQSPSGTTRHQILVGPNTTSLQVATDLTSVTAGGQWINITYSPVLTNVRFLRLYTVSSPSWVAWMKFLVYGS